MQNSFLNYILPKDEYKRLNMLYYFAEASLIAIVTLGLLALLHFTFFDWNYSVDLLLLTPFLMIFYVTLRHMFSGMEYSDVITKSNYKKVRSEKLMQTITATTIFLILTLIFQTFPTSIVSWIKIVMPVLLFGLFFFFFNMISLKKSYQKNSELED